MAHSIKIINTLKEFQNLIKNFECQNDCLIFRGHDDAKHKLTPSAFRYAEIIKSWQRFPIQKTDIVEFWFNSDECIEKLRHSFPNYNGNYECYKFLYKRNRIIAPGQIITLENYLWSLVEIMRYNHDLKNFYDDDKNYSIQYDRHRLGINNSPGNYSFPDNYFYDKKTFIYLIPSVFPYDRTDQITGDPIIVPHIPEELTGYDESYAQHYGCDARWPCYTSSLDWTFDYHIAIFFAVRKMLNHYEPYEIQKTPIPEYFSIYSLKKNSCKQDIILQTYTDQDRSTNPRMYHQKGALISLPKANYYYLTHSKTYPSMEYYIDLGDAFVSKFCIRNTDEILKFSSKLFTSKNICEDTLHL